MRWIAFASVLLVAVSLIVVVAWSGLSSCAEQPGEGASLPDPAHKGTMSVEEAIQQRRSRRVFQDKPLTKQELAQVLWAAQGITGERGKRASPSAGATYPMDVYAVVGAGGCADLAAGVYRYQPRDHSLAIQTKGDKRANLAAAALGQRFVAQAPVVIVLTAEYERTTRRYGERGIRYVHMEAGHVGENVYLQAEALGLGTCAVGAFPEEEVSKLLEFPQTHTPLYLMPVGKPE